jgi:hypothetical protein
MAAGGGGGGAGEEKLVHALNVLRRMPPAAVASDLKRLVQIAPELEDDLLEKVDQPLATDKCAKTGKTFLKCDYNRDGASYRCVPPRAARACCRPARLCRPRAGLCGARGGVRGAWGGSGGAGGPGREDWAANGLRAP